VFLIVVVAQAMIDNVGIQISLLPIETGEPMDRREAK